MQRLTLHSREGQIIAARKGGGYITSRAQILLVDSCLATPYSLLQGYLEGLGQKTRALCLL
jgi:hypothetical protein